MKKTNNKHRAISKILAWLVTASMVVSGVSVAYATDEAPDSTAGQQPDINVMLLNLEDPQNDGTPEDQEDHSDSVGSSSDGQEDGNTPAPTADEGDDQTSESSSDASSSETSSSSEVPPTQDEEFDLTKTERPEQSDDVTTDTGSEKKEPSENPDEKKDWTVFYDEENDVYKLNFNIGADASGDQTLDLTKALELLGEYAATAEKPTEPEKDFVEPGLSEEDQAKLDAYEDELKVWDEEDYPQICDIVEMFNYPGYIEAKGLTMEQVVAEFNSIGIGHAEIPVKPDVAEVDKTSPEYLEYLDKLAAYEEQYEEYLKKMAAYELRSEADHLQPGDVRKFEIYFTSDSKHTYKYKDGSFTLATPWWNPENGNEGGTTGFDGQLLPGDYLDKKDYHVTLRCDPIQHLLVNELGVDSWDAWNSLPGYVDNQVKKYLAEKYGQDSVAANLNAYLLDYYNSKDGTQYTSIDELVKNNAEAKTELTKTATSGNKWFDVNGETFVVDAHLETELYDTFYKQLFSFAYGDKADIDSITGQPKPGQGGNGRPGYENDSWTDNGYKNALYYYMAHEEIWETTNSYFKQLLAGGLTAEQATWTSFMMALNIDGELTGNDWQNTKWPWYNSIQLEQMDYKFELNKTDSATGALVSTGETTFELYTKDKDGKLLYCSYDAATNTYAFVPERSTITTNGSKLDIDFAMLKDMVYYIRETVAPSGYQLDETIYLIMSESDYANLTKEQKDELEGTFGALLGSKDENGNVSANFSNARIIVTPDPEDPDPEDPDEPDPEDPTVEIPDEPTPLTELPPEDDLIDIFDEDVPLADAAGTGNLDAVWYLVAILSVAGVLALGAAERKAVSKN